MLDTGRIEQGTSLECSFDETEGGFHDPEREGCVFHLPDPTGSFLSFRDKEHMH